MILSCFLPNIIGVIKCGRIRGRGMWDVKGEEKYRVGGGRNEGKAPTGRLKHGYEE
jgi:hypothetical protein